MTDAVEPSGNRSTCLHGSLPWLESSRGAEVKYKTPRQHVNPQQRVVSRALDRAVLQLQQTLT